MKSLPATKIMRSESGVFLTKFLMVFAVTAAILFSLLILITPFAELLVAIVVGYLMAALFVSDFERIE